MAKKTAPKSAAEQAKSQHFSISSITPLSKNQELTFEKYNDGQHLILSGSAGSGKSFLAMYLALKDIMNEKLGYKKLLIIRSAVPTRDLGFVPGTLEEKSKIYQEPYMNIVNELIGRGDAWYYLINKDIVDFQTTSFLRGLTFSQTIVIFDEFQSASFHEIDTVLTRIGPDTRFILCGDYNQNDLKKESSGFGNAIKILDKMDCVSHIEFTVDDIVRSGFVRDYIRMKENTKL